MSDNEKTNLKVELIARINEILDKNALQEIDNLTMINSSKITSYLGSIKIFDENKLEIIKSDIGSLFNEYGNYSLRTEEVISCCKPPYKNISFKVDIIDSN
jgi:hypothetical protein